MFIQLESSSYYQTLHLLQTMSLFERKQIIYGRHPLLPTFLIVPGCFYAMRSPPYQRIFAPFKGKQTPFYYGLHHPAILLLVILASSI